MDDHRPGGGSNEAQEPPNSVPEGDHGTRKTAERPKSQVGETQTTAGQLALEVMHEIENPLEALGNLTYLAHEEAADPEKVRRYMRMAQEQMATLHHVVTHTLGYARSAKRAKASNMVELADAALRIHQTKISAKNIRLLRTMPDELMAEVHTGEILQVFSNLIVNALDALPADGTLCVRMRKSAGEVHIVIADNGHGIADFNALEVFKPFFTTKEERGTGLGLALSKRIVERHRGRIRLRSSVHPVRHGTAFKVCLPLH